MTDAYLVNLARTGVPAVLPSRRKGMLASHSPVQHSTAAPVDLQLQVKFPNSFSLNDMHIIPHSTCPELLQPSAEIRCTACRWSWSWFVAVAVAYAA